MSYDVQLSDFPTFYSALLPGAVIGPRKSVTIKKNNQNTYTSAAKFEQHIIIPGGGGYFSPFP